MPVLTVLLIVVIIGVIVYLVSFIPMNPTFYRIIVVLAILLTLIWIGQVAGLIGGPRIMLK